MPDSQPVASCDLLIRAGRIVCPLTGFDQAGAVAIRGDRIVAVAARLEMDCRQMIDEPHSILLPGLIDLHAHPARSGSRFGVAPDAHLLAHGTTTVLSQGDAGAGHIETYIRDTIETSRTRILLAINLASCGETGPNGCFEDVQAADASACVRAVARHRRHIWGIAVNTSHHCCGRTDPRDVFRRGIQAADQTGLPLLYGMRRPEDWPLEDQLRQLRPGDVVTYAFRRTPHCIVKNDRVIDAVRHARERGVLFDVGHGCASFDFETAESALRDGFAPDTISTDLQRGHLDQALMHDLPLVMSKLRAAGMTERNVFQSVTSHPARILGLSEEVGSLKIGSHADVVLLRWHESKTPLCDTHGNTRLAGRWEQHHTIRNGVLV